MANNSIWGWKLRGVGAAIREDQYAHTPPLGTARNACPTCGEARDMTCYRLADGPFGSRKGLHLVCPTCGSTFAVDKADEAKVLAVLVPAGGNTA